MNRDIWAAAEKEVRAALETMPVSHRRRFAEISKEAFPEIVSELLLIKQRFNLESTDSHQSRLAGRYKHVYVVLTRCVSLTLLGVPSQIALRSVVRELGKLPGDQESHQPGIERESNEETSSNGDVVSQDLSAPEETNLEF